MGTITVEEKLEKLKEVFEKCGDERFEFHALRVATPEEFYEAIGNAKKSNPHGAFVEQHSIEEYSNMRFLFVTLDGKAGIAITSDNNIVSIFNGGEQRGVLKTLLPTAIEFGGRKLDNYNAPKLSATYELYGFNPISKTEFDKKFAPSDWNYERDGEPDIVFWIHDDERARDVLYNFGGYDIDWTNIKLFTTYHEAEKYRDDLLNEKKHMN